MAKKSDIVVADIVPTYVNFKPLIVIPPISLQKVKQTPVKVTAAREKWTGFVEGLLVFIESIKYTLKVP